jgi:hypothetical protein
MPALRSHVPKSRVFGMWEFSRSEIQFAVAGILRMCATKE